jgi:hypothetical protein
MMMNNTLKHKSFMLRIGAFVGIVMIVISGSAGLASAQDQPAPPLPTNIERPSENIDLRENQECCECARNETAFDGMVVEACRGRYKNAETEGPTEIQLNDCITKLKAQVLENCDRDLDGVSDAQDNCPNVPNPRQAVTDPIVKRFDGKCQFIDNGDGTVTEHHKGLLWLKDTNSGGEMTWDEANAFCRELQLAGGEGQCQNIGNCLES